MKIIPETYIDSLCNTCEHLCIQDIPMDGSCANYKLAFWANPAIIPDWEDAAKFYQRMMQNSLKSKHRDCTECTKKYHGFNRVDADGFCVSAGQACKYLHAYLATEAEMDGKE